MLQRVCDACGKAEPISRELLEDGLTEYCSECQAKDQLCVDAATREAHAFYDRQLLTLRVSAGLKKP